jgi:hypothetical protein
MAGAQDITQSGFFYGFFLLTKNKHTNSLEKYLRINTLIKSLFLS